MTLIILYAILLTLVCILVTLTIHAWSQYQQGRKIAAYLDSLGDMIGDMLRELIDTTKGK